MTDPMRALEAFRDVEVPVGARTRVRARIEAHVDRRAITQGSSRRRWAIAFALAAPLAIAAVLVGWPRSEARAITVATGDHYDVALGSGQVSIRGPAAVHVSRDQLSLLQGTVAARGQLRVKGPACNVDVRGSVEVSVTGAQLTVRVFAGSVEITPPVTTCEVIELTPKPPITASAARDPESHAIAAASPPPTELAPTKRRPAVRAAPVEAPAETTADPLPPSPAASVAPAADPLADAVAAYHAAVALEADDLPAARRAWQTWRSRWSTSPLAQSADLHLLAVLDRLDRHGDAVELAREFVQRYPRSPRRAEVERMIKGGQ